LLTRQVVKNILNNAPNKTTRFRVFSIRSMQTVTTGKFLKCLKIPVSLAILISCFPGLCTGTYFNKFFVCLDDQMRPGGPPVHGDGSTSPVWGGSYGQIYAQDHRHVATLTFQ
jgi:hypothetical protein